MGLMNVPLNMVLTVNLESAGCMGSLVSSGFYVGSYGVVRAGAVWTDRAGVRARRAAALAQQSYSAQTD